MEQVTSEHAELCGVSLVAGDRLKLEALHHENPDALHELRHAVESSPPKLSESPSGQVVLTGRSLFLPEVDPEIARQQASSNYRGWLERFMPSSVIIAPLRTNAKIIGTLGAFRGQGSPPFTEDDVRFLEDLGERAAMALETSRLYRDNVLARKRTELLYELSRAVIAAEDIREVHDLALSALERSLGARRAAILTMNEDSVMRFRAWRGLSDAYRAAVEGHSPWPSDVRDPHPIFVEHARSNPDLARYRSLFVRENIGALGFFPLVASGRLVGKFVVYYDEPREIPNHEVQMARAIADHVAAATARFSAVDGLRQTVRFNEMFTGMLGHDLRNPLAAIMTAAQLVIRRSSDPRTTTPLYRILSSGERMTRMIDQLLDFTRVRVGQGIPIARGPLDLLPLLRQAIEELESTLGRKMKLHVEGNTSGAWDADRLSQVFSNLVANAIQHGSAEHPVSVRAEGTDASVVRVVVHNQGTVRTELLPRLFEPMLRDTASRVQPRGLGLGLYISQQIAKAHSGSIEVTSDAKDGTAFIVTLPRRGEETSAS
jgi:signal transduction histidine kinase